MTTNVLSIPYPEELLLSPKENPVQFEAEARLLLAVKLYECGYLGQVQETDWAVQFSGTPRGTERTTESPCGFGN